MGNPQIEGKSEIEIRQTLGEPTGEKIVVERIYTDKNPQEAMGGGSKGGRDATNAPPRRPRHDAINRDAAVLIATRQLLNAMRVWGRDAARHVATKTVGSDIDGRILGLVWDAYGEAVGVGIFALRRPRPYSRTFAGIPFHRMPPADIFTPT